MWKIRYVLLCLIILSMTKGLLHAQSDYPRIDDFQCFVHPDLCQDSLSPLEEYNALLSFNAINKYNLLKSDEDYTHRLDSTKLWDRYGLSYKNESTSTNNGKTEIFFRYDYDKESNSWIPGRFLSVYHFNERNLVNMQLSYYWNGSKENWKESELNLVRHYFYNDNDQLIELQTQSAYNLMNDNYNDITYYHYDSTGLATGYSYYLRDYIADSMFHYRERVQRYNQDRQLEQIIDHVYTTYNNITNWYYDDSTHFSYYPDGHLYKESYFNWDFDGFYPYSQTTNNYNDDGTLNNQVYYLYYDNLNNNWKNRHKLEYIYHPYGSLRRIKNIDSTSAFPKVFTSEYYIYEHDPDVTYSDIQFPLTRGNNKMHYHQNHMLIEQEHRYQDLFSSSTIDYKIRYYYSEIDPVSAQEETISQYKVMIYPNPTTDIIRIDVPDYSGRFTVTITDLNGEQCKKARMQSGDQISLIDLQPGLYFYTVELDGDVVSGKVVRI